jgi:hypothetical protein
MKPLHGEPLPAEPEVNAQDVYPGAILHGDVMLGQEIADRESHRAHRGTVIAGAALFLLLELFMVWALLHNIGIGCYKLNETVVGIFVNGVVVQHYFVIRIIVKNLFPSGADQPLSKPDV